MNRQQSRYIIFGTTIFFVAITAGIIGYKIGLSDSTILTNHVIQPSNTASSTPDRQEDRVKTSDITEKNNEQVRITKEGVVFTDKMGYESLVLENKLFVEGDVQNSFDQVIYNKAILSPNGEWIATMGACWEESCTYLYNVNTKQQHLASHSGSNIFWKDTGILRIEGPCFTPREVACGPFESVDSERPWVLFSIPTEEQIQLLLQASIVKEEFNELYGQGMYGPKTVEIDEVVPLNEKTVRLILCHSPGAGCWILPYYIDLDVSNSEKKLSQMDKNIHELFIESMALVYSPDLTKVATVKMDVLPENFIKQTTYVVNLRDFSVSIKKEAKEGELFMYACDPYFPRFDYPSDRIKWVNNELQVEYIKISDVMSSTDTLAKNCMKTFLNLYLNTASN